MKNPEQEYRNKIDKTLEKYFDIETECVSFCKKKRIDYILRCKKSDALFGLEVKNTYRKRGNDIGKFAKQASEYSNLFWITKFTNKPIKVLVFVAPAISNYIKNIIVESLEITNGRERYIAFHNSEHEHSNVNGFIGEALNFGEIRTLSKFHFIFSFKNRIIWENKDGGSLHINNYNFYNERL